MDLLEKTLLAHRYLYYVAEHAVIPDYEYDALEKGFALENGKDFIEVHGVGSELPEDYSPEVVRHAKGLFRYFKGKDL